MFLKIFKKVSSPLRSWHFANCRHFSYLLTVCYFLSADTTDKKYFNFEVVDLKKFY